MTDTGALIIGLLAASALFAVGGVLFKIFILFRILRRLALPGALAVSLGIGGLGTQTETGSRVIDAIAGAAGYEKTTGR